MRLRVLGPRKYSEKIAGYKNDFGFKNTFLPRHILYWNPNKEHVLEQSIKIRFQGDLSILKKVVLDTFLDAKSHFNQEFCDEVRL